MTLEDSPEFQKALNEACEKQYRGYLYGGEFAKAHSKDTIGATMEEMQRRRKEIEAKSEDLRRHAEQMRREAMLRTGHMGEITENLKRKHGSTGLICPVCGGGDHGNRLNGKPYCLMNAKHKAKGVNGPAPLMTPEKAKNWKPPKKILTLRETIEEELGTPKDVVIYKKKGRK